MKLTTLPEDVEFLYQCLINLLLTTVTETRRKLNEWLFSISFIKFKLE